MLGNGILWRVSDCGGYPIVAGFRPKFLSLSKGPRLLYSDSRLVGDSARRSR